MRLFYLVLLASFLSHFVFSKSYALPTGFVYLRDIDASILQEIRYAETHNFIGRKVKGYEDHECILTKEAANALAKVQAELHRSSFSLKVYDCYRPKMAVEDFIVWSQDKKNEVMKTEFYPNVDKSQLFSLGYIAKKSGHSRGSTIDLTIVPNPPPHQAIYHPNEKLFACTASYQKRFHDNSIDMGTGYDCLDKLAHLSNNNLNTHSLINRKLLRQIMEKHHFIPYSKEWWHFTLNDEPYPNTYFDFKVIAKRNIAREKIAINEMNTDVQASTEADVQVSTKADVQASSESVKYIMTLADIHFDPFLTCKTKPCPLIQTLRQTPITEWPTLFSQAETEIKYLHDSSYTLIKSALMAAKLETEKKDVQFVLILGDFLGHNFKTKFKASSTDYSNESFRLFVNKVIAFLTNEISEAFPKLDVYSVVGNNDTYQRDYQSIPGGPFFKEIAKRWPMLIKTKLNRMIAQKELANAGYYAVPIQGQPNLRLIVLNTNLFSDNAIGTGTRYAAYEQLNWLKRELQYVKDHQQKAFIAMHIPQGVDLYATKWFRLFNLLVLWKPDYIERFQALIDEFSPYVTAIFAGHLHLDLSYIKRFQQNEIIQGQTPSISPIFGNNPGFKIYQFQPQSFKVQPYATHYYYPLNKNQIWSSKATNRLLTCDNHS